MHLTRMQAVDDRSPRAPLTKAERAHVMPRFVKAQTEGETARDKVRIAAKRASILAKRDAAIANANAEFEGFSWLMDHGINTGDVIYYNHTGRFGFGWRGQGLDDCVVSRLLEIISEFPGSYDITCADGRKLSGN